jgi:hypothetical protein
LTTTDPDPTPTYCPDCGGACGSTDEYSGCQCVDCPVCLDTVQWRPLDPVCIDQPTDEPYHTTINVGGEVL